MAGMTGGSTGSGGLGGGAAAFGGGLPGGPGGGGDGGGGGGGGGSGAVQSPAFSMSGGGGGGVPVSGELLAEAMSEGEAIEEDEVPGLRMRIAELEAALAGAEARLSAQASRLTLERELTAAGVVDLETGVALAERLLEGGDEDDPARAVARLRARKPFLFPDGGTTQESAGRGGFGMSGSMSGGMVEGGAGAALDEMASTARSSGDRRELLRYLRARRGM